MSLAQILGFLLISGISLGHNEELRFLVLGDWGGMMLYPYTTLYERTVSKTMGEVAEKLGTQFTIALGEEPILLQGYYCRDKLWRSK